MIEEYTGIDKVPVTCGFLSLCAALLVGSGFYFLLRGFDLCVCGTASFVRGFLLVTRRVSGWAQIQLVLRASSTFLRAAASIFPYQFNYLSLYFLFYSPTHSRHKIKKRPPFKGPLSYCESIGLYNLTSGFFSWNHLSAKSFSNRKTFLS